MNMRSPKVLLMVALLAACGAVLIFQRVNRPAPRASQQAADSLAAGAAEEVGRLVGGSGGVVVIRAIPDGLFPGASDEFPVQLASSLTARADIKFLGMESVRAFGTDLSDLPQGAATPPDATGEAPSLSWETFSRVTEKYPGVRAVVSLIGPPQLANPGLESWGAAVPHLILIMQKGDPRVAREAMREGAVDLAIVPRERGPGADSPPPSAGPSWLTVHYEVLGPASAGK